MPNLTPRRTNNDGIEYELMYRSGIRDASETRPAERALHISVGHSKSGREPGIVFRVHPCSLTDDGMMSFMLFADSVMKSRSSMVRRVPRRSDKQTAAVAAIIDPLLPELTALWYTDNAAAVRRFVEIANTVSAEQGFRAMPTQ